MTFLTPWMLAGVLAAGIPVAIHLFFRSRYRRVPWAAMKFLLTSIEQTSRRLKFQELLLLLLRMLILVLLAIAFMRPVSTIVRGLGRGDSVDAIFVIDTSFSMAGKDDDAKTRLDRAKDEALKIIEELPAHSTVQIITASGANAYLVGPKSPGNLDQARKLIESLDITHLNTDLHNGAKKAQEVLKIGQAANKEFYLFSDMQKTGFDQYGGELKSSLTDIKEKAIVHFVRCGTRSLKSAAILDIKPQSGVPRPRETVGFAVVVRNSGTEALTNVRVTLTVDGDDKTADSTQIAKIGPGETQAVTLTNKLSAPGLRVLTARLSADDLEADNRFDQVIQVRDQVNVLVVDGNFNERDPEKSSSYFLMHALLPVKDAERATYKYNPRAIPARLASPALLKNQDVCILVNCALQLKLGQRGDAIPGDFADALGDFVKKGHGLIIVSGDNVQPDAYNKVLGQKLGLLPLPVKAKTKSQGKFPLFLNRDTFGQGPASFWKIKDDQYYALFEAVPIYQFVDLDDSALIKAAPPKKDEEPQEPKKKDEVKKDEPEKKDEDPVHVIVRLSNDRPLVVSKKIDKGEVIFVGTAMHPEGRDATTNLPTWTGFHERWSGLPLLTFNEITLSHLMHGQAQNFNVAAGQTLNWYVTDKLEHVYNLVHPDKTIERLPQPTKVGNRMVIVKNDLARAGVYRIFSHARGLDGQDAVDITAALKASTPIAVAPDLSESADLSALSDAQIDERIGFQPIHIIAGAGAAGGSSGIDRLNREWTVWVLLAVFVLVLFEVALAWWCGRGW